jgi:hypothetical protein
MHRHYLCAEESRRPQVDAVDGAKVFRLEYFTGMEIYYREARAG